MAAAGSTWVAGFVAVAPATSTRPAATSSPAWPRDRASPRRTSSASSRRSRAMRLLLDVGEPVLQGAMDALEHPEPLLERSGRDAGERRDGGVHGLVAGPGRTGRLVAGGLGHG